MRKDAPNGPQGQGENQPFLKQLLLQVVGFGLNAALVFLPLMLPTEVTIVQLCTDSTIPAESVHANCS
ncbi:hypothetical protein [Nocardia salmonicida]|uniref:hypothetical protein n=1 Tax=Nocardia salmonicida TaxID=53431 RepID=UPI00379B2BC1